MSQKLQYWFVHFPNTVKTTYNVTLVPLVATDKLLWENTEQNDINTTLYRHTHPQAHTHTPPQYHCNSNTSPTYHPTIPLPHFIHHTPPKLISHSPPPQPSQNHTPSSHPPQHTLHVHRISSSKVLDILCPFTKVTWICHVF